MINVALKLIHYYISRMAKFTKSRVINAVLATVFFAAIPGSYYIGYLHALPRRPPAYVAKQFQRREMARAQAEALAMKSKIPKSALVSKKQLSSTSTAEPSEDSKSTRNHRRTRLAVVTHLDEPAWYMSQFLSLVYPSWKWVTSHQKSVYSKMTNSEKRQHESSPSDHTSVLLGSADVLADLVVFVDANLSHLLAIMPPGCRLLPSVQDDVPSLSAEEHFRTGPQCYFATTDPASPANRARIPTTNDYRFMQSIEFLTSTEFDVIVQDSGWYDFFLRIDTDCLLGPGLLSYAPSAGQAAFGSGFMGYPSGRCRCIELLPGYTAGASYFPSSPTTRTRPMSLSGCMGAVATLMQSQLRPVSMPFHSFSPHWGHFF
eukprot:m.562345 g.562345  ORF g.562345 m.562345 type:complete len:374 (+) comp22221_c0_seq15:349-1470(+)